LLFGAPWTSILRAKNKRETAPQAKFLGKMADSKIFVKWYNPENVQNMAPQGKFLTLAKKYNKKSSNPGSLRTGPLAAAPPALRLIRAWIKP
jgi:hypothetical protein